MESIDWERLKYMDDIKLYLMTGIICKVAFFINILMVFDKLMDMSYGTLENAQWI